MKASATFVSMLVRLLHCHHHRHYSHKPTTDGSAEHECNGAHALKAATACAAHECWAEWWGGIQAAEKGGWMGEEGGWTGEEGG